MPLTVTTAREVPHTRESWVDSFFQHTPASSEPQTSFSNVYGHSAPVSPAATMMRFKIGMKA